MSETDGTRAAAPAEGEAARATRLALRRFTLADAPFALRLLNEPSFLKNIGDKGVRTVQDAERYLSDGPLRSYATYGHGLLLVLLPDGTPVGMCGLLKRDELDGVDLGYAFVPEAWGRGLALEAAASVLADARRTLGIERVLAIVNPDNERSIRLLEKLDFRYVRAMRLKPEAGEVRLYERLASAREADGAESSR